MYLLVSDVTKMMEISEKAFCKKYSDKIVEIPGCRKCIAETDFNLLISDDKELFKKMGMLEVTKVETLRSEIASIISFQPLKFMMAKEYLNMMKIKTGCKSEQQYVEKYEIPKEFDEALQRFMNSHHDNSYYKSMINYLKNKECFDLDKIRELGLDIQYLSSITSDGSMTLEVFVVGKGIFYSVLEDDEGEQWNEIHIDEMGNIKLPYFSYYSDRVEERIINRELIGQRELLQLSMETANNRIEISKINSDMISIEKQISDVVEGLKDVVTKSELADMMNSFISDDDEKWLMYNAKFSSADEVYASIYRQAKVSIYVVDNYIGLRTLVHLKNSQSGVSIILFSDNVGNNKLHNIEFTDFCKEYPDVKISMQKTGEIFHDRFIVLDYGTADERVFLCGASSKDAGARITSIVEDYGTKKYASVMATLLQNPPLVLPK